MQRKAFTDEKMIWRVGKAYDYTIKIYMDGIGFIDQPHTMTDLFDVDYVLDKVNRPEKYWNK